MHRRFTEESEEHLFGLDPGDLALSLYFAKTFSLRASHQSNLASLSLLISKMDREQDQPTCLSGTAPSLMHWSLKGSCGLQTANAGREVSVYWALVAGGKSRLQVAHLYVCPLWACRSSNSNILWLWQRGWGDASNSEKGGVMSPATNWPISNGLVSGCGFWGSVETITWDSTISKSNSRLAVGPQNLELMPTSPHTRIHSTDGPLTPAWIRYTHGVALVPLTATTWLCSYLSIQPDLTCMVSAGLF